MTQAGWFIGIALLVPALAWAGDLAELQDVAATVTGVTSLVFLIGGFAIVAAGLFVIIRGLLGGREHLTETVIAILVVAIVGVFMWRAVPAFRDGITAEAAAATLDAIQPLPPADDVF